MAKDAVLQSCILLYPAEFSTLKKAHKSQLDSMYMQILCFALNVLLCKAVHANIHFPSIS